MDTGQLRHRITLQAPHRITSAATGQEILTWHDLREVWASIDPLTSNEIVRHRQSALETTHRIVIRYRANVGTDWRIVYGGHVFRIDGKIDPGLRHVWLELSAVELSHG